MKYSYLSLNENSRVIELPERFKKDILQTHFISDTRYKIGKGYVELTISQNMAPLLLELKNRFTSYGLENIKHLASVYSIRIYEMIKSFEDLGNRVFSIEDLRNKLDLKPGELVNFADFNRRVLEISQREINGKTDMRLSYEPIKEGRKVTQVRFAVKFVKPRKTMAETIQLPLNTHGSGESIGSIANNLVKRVSRKTTTKNRVSACKKVSKPSIIDSKPIKKKTVVQTKKSKTDDVLLLKPSLWQRVKYIFMRAFKE